MKTTLFTLLTFMAIGMMAQEGPGIEWQKTYNFTGNGNDEGNEIRPTSDGGYIMVGNAQMSDDPNDYDVYVVKIDSDGELQWQNTYGGSNGDYGNSIKQTTDGGYIVAGATRSNDGDVSGNYFESTFDLWIFKIDAEGDFLWQNCLGGTNNEWANKIIPHSGGGYLISGYATSGDGDVEGIHIGWSGSPSIDYWIIKIDDSGNLEWQKCLGGKDSDDAKDIIETSTGNLAIVGTSNSWDGDVVGSHGTGVNDLWFVMLNTEGELLWQRPYGGAYQEEGSSIEEISDGFIIAGFTQSSDGDATGNEFGDAVWVLRIDTEGEIVWQSAFGGSNFEFGNDVTQTEDGGFIVAAQTSSLDGQVTGYHQPPSGMSSDYWVLKLDNDGNLEWQNALGGTNNEFANSLLQSPDGKFLVAGTTNSNDWDVTNNPNRSIWLVKVLGSDEMGVEDIAESNFKIYPIPTSNVLNFSEKLNQIEIYAMDGSLVQTATQTKSIQVQNLTNGTYILKATDEKGNTIRSKFVKK